MSGTTIAVTLVILALGIVLGFFLYPGAIWLRQKIRPDDPDEVLRTAIEEHTSDDEIEAAEVKQERKMLRSILDLAEVTVVEVMSHRRQMVTIDADLPAGEIVDAALASPFTRLPLWRDEPDNIIGVLHAKSLLREVRAARGKMESFVLEEVASQPWFVPDATSLLDQLQAFRTRREHFALVVDEYGSLLGLVTLEDILEEIVGDITDELDTHVAGVFPQPDGSYIVDGTVTVRDLNREFDWELPDETDYSTIAGLVIYESRHIPEVGQTFTFFGFRFEILKRLRNQVTTIRVTPPGSAGPSE
ncbi:MAG TPA: transporter associated domain-containing protein [Alphaproteobacteria bacterium]|jgi:Mg2+/Co2+ transporter CorB|nr:transporter associated domain-containing protein [Alphaproteobacteria bacterium]